MKSVGITSKLVVVLISLHLLMSAVHSSAPVSATGVTTSVQINDKSSDDWALTMGKSVSLAPSSLKDFSEMVVKQLSEQQVFSSWNHSELQYFPLGPGTHSWLVTVSRDEKELGYLILTAKNTNTQEYILSEYGTSPSSPYDLTALHHTLAELDIISPSSTSPTSIVPLYAPLLPLWKVSFGHQETLYLNALTMDVLAWDESHWKKLNPQTAELSDTLFSSKGDSFTSSQVISSKGQKDPYDNLMWITSTPLSVSSDLDVESYINKHNSLIFTSPNHNDDVGGPFAISGYQKWYSTQEGTHSVVYAGTGLTGHRYVPLSILLNKGIFHAFPLVSK
ncbi:hypothetical protein [Paenibacillus antarcticus]|uniref:Uncharacterized protein n=1 Tax=Paenibacillus antarcticus TaxID=253703 RepID=A0A162KCD0_9BACL|nr:hypothetical protein [Paenibacillus antarcticus]OAB43688.1 hypothetical protein PBAT_17670 [Paenibacillus antarcticus]